MINDNEYLSFEEVLQERDKSKFTNTTLGLLLNIVPTLTKNRCQDSEQAFQEITDFLKDKGFKKFKILSKDGANIIAFNTVDNQIIKITHKQTLEYGRNIESPFILQPISVDDIGDYEIKIYPKVKTLQDYVNNGELTEKMAQKKIQKLILVMGESGILLHDGVFDNIALMTDRTAVVIDAGASIINQMQTQTNPKRGTPWVNAEGIWKQHELYPEILTGEIKGVYAKGDIPDKFPDTKAGKIVQAIIEDGAYRPEVSAKIYNEAEKKGELGRLADKIEEIKNRSSNMQR